MGFMRNEYRITPKTHPSRLRHSLRVPIIVLLVLILAESSLAIALVAGNPLDKNPAGSFLPYTEIGFDSPVGDDSLQIINVPAPGTTTVKPPDPPDPNAPRIYLTFDDGPSSESTTKIIDILETYGIKATFFVLGSQAEQLPDMVRLISSKGHTVANHGYSHNYDTIYRSADAFMQDIGKCESILSNILDKPPVRIIRFPAGSAAVELDNNPGIRTSIKQLLQAGGWRYFDWTVSLGDSIYDGAPEPGYLASYLIGEIETKISVGATDIVVLAHDTNSRPWTPADLPTVIEYCQAQGYAFEALTLTSPRCEYR